MEEDFDNVETRTKRRKRHRKRNRKKKVKNVLEKEEGEIVQKKMEFSMPVLKEMEGSEGKKEVDDDEWEEPQYTEEQLLALEKYYNQKYRLFFRFDEGIRLDYESWYSATPELLATHIAQRCACGVIVDGFCGPGGNAIQFALTCDFVIAIDINPERIALAKHNAKVYGVSHKIEFIVGDFLELAPKLKADAVFLAPPWGGPQYSEAESISLHDLSPDGVTIFDQAAKISKNICYLLPKNIVQEELIELSSKLSPWSKCEIENNNFNKRTKAITSYFGNLVQFDE